MRELIVLENMCVCECECECERERDRKREGEREEYSSHFIKDIDTHTPKMVECGIHATYSGRGCQRDSAAESVVRAIVRGAPRVERGADGGYECSSFVASRGPGARG